jgi:glycolate oxidase FAD binding subunit
MQKETIPEFGVFQSVLVAQPTTVAELGSIVRDAAAQGQAVFPLGGRTMLGLGLLPSKPGVAVDLRSLNHVIDYPAPDMTITVQAGITIAKLQAILAAENQQLPVDVPMPEQATLGGAIAVNASGPRRYGYGTLRDYVIGISFINSEGHEVKAGGRVVKNVAGYDLMKLHIGALGTLGIVTQVTLKLRPQPQEQIALTLGFPATALGPILEQLHQTSTRPVLLELFNGVAINSMSLAAREFLSGAPWFALIDFEENKETVLWQAERLQKEMVEAWHDGTVISKVGGPTWQLWQSFITPPALEPSQLCFKASVLPSATAAFCLRADSLPYALQVRASAGNGIILGQIDDLTLEQAKTMLSTSLDAAGPEGNMVVTRCPPEWKRELPIWGKPRGDGWLMRRVKEALDPRGVFNPGRFVDGI